MSGCPQKAIFGMAAGMATLGLVPIVSTFSCFIVSRAHDSIRVLIAQPKANVKMMGGYAGLLAGMTGKTHLMFDDISIMRAMANMTVVAPVDEVETRSALAAIMEYDGPVYFRLNRPDTPIVGVTQLFIKANRNDIHLDVELTPDLGEVVPALGAEVIGDPREGVDDLLVLFVGTGVGGGAVTGIWESSMWAAGVSSLSP